MRWETLRIDTLTISMILFLTKGMLCLGHVKMGNHSFFKPTNMQKMLFTPLFRASF